MRLNTSDNFYSIDKYHQIEKIEDKNKAFNVTVFKFLFSYSIKVFGSQSGIIPVLTTTQICCLLLQTYLSTY